MTKRIYTTWLAATVLLVVSYPLMTEGVRAVVYLALAAASVVAIAAATLARDLRPRQPLLLLAVGLLAFLVGDSLWIYYDTVLGIDPFPSKADISYLSGYPLLALALWAMLRRRSPVRDRGSLIDASVVTVGGALVTWVFLIVPLASDPSLGLSGRVFAAAYPAGDLMLLALLVRLSLTPGGRSVAHRLLTAGVGIMLVADLMFAVGELTGIDVVLPSDTGYLLSYVLMASSVLHPSINRVAAPTRLPQQTLTRSRLALLAAASLLAPTVLALQSLTGMPIQELLIATTSAALFLLVVLRMSGLVRQVEEHAAQIEAIARVDSLTGVPNRRSWDEQLPVELARAARSDTPVCVALLDVDQFKLYNDTYGHPAGDELLRQATAAWQRELRAADALARYGGEEFGVVLPGCTVSQALRIVERLRAATPAGQTCSAGVALWDGSEAADELVIRADRALYEAKTAGRDRAISAEPSTAAGLPLP